MRKLSEICKRLIIKETNVYEDYDIYGIETNSKNIKEGYIFVVTDGNEEYLNDAIENGAICIVSKKTYNFPCIKVDDVRESLALMCSDFYDNPERQLKIIGVVGTNGKTSITNILYELFKPYKKVAVIGTVGIKINDEEYGNTMTTPDPPLLFSALKRAVECDCEYVFCEITSHAIYYKKTYGIRCEICVFTNITQDHLDFFVNMNNYAKTKLDFFNKSNMKIAVVNADDEYGNAIIKNNQICSISYGLNQPSDIFAIDINTNKGLKFIANAFDDIIYVATRFEGKFNVYNILACIAVARISGIPAKDIQSRLRMLIPVEGRADCIHNKPKIIIDYAHTPDGLKNILESLRETETGRIIAVFGCGGNRDTLKRPLMGEIGTRLADICIFTTDNPRYEKPEDIIAEIENGANGRKNYVSITDRTNAIDFALHMASKNDCIVICGKGAEKHMEINGVKVNYSDKEVCQAIMEKINWEH